MLTNLHLTYLNLLKIDLYIFPFVFILNFDLICHA